MAKHADKYALIRSVLSHRRRGSRHRPSDDADRPPVSGRHRVSALSAACSRNSKARTATCPPHVLLPRPIGNTGGNMPHGQNAGFLGKSFDPFVLNADPSDPNFKVPDMLPPDYLTALRVDRRRNWREMIDKSVSKFETSQDARLLDSTFHQAYTLMSSQKAREAFELSREPREHSRKIRHEPLRPKLPAGAPPDRSRRALRHRQHVRDGVRRDHLGHSRLETVQPDQLLSRPGGPDVRHGLQLAAGGLERARPARPTPWSSRRASSAARRRSIPPADAITGRNAGPC